MNWQEFLSLQGNSIATALEAEGYQAERMENGLGWKITQSEQDWWLMLTFIPQPVAQWRLLPATFDPIQNEIYSVIEKAIGGRR